MYKVPLCLRCCNSLCMDLFLQIQIRIKWGAGTRGNAHQTLNHVTHEENAAEADFSLKCCIASDCSCTDTLVTAAAVQSPAGWDRWSGDSRDKCPAENWESGTWPGWPLTLLNLLWKAIKQVGNKTFTDWKDEDEEKDSGEKSRLKRSKLRI